MKTKVNSVQNSLNFERSILFKTDRRHLYGEIGFGNQPSGISCFPHFLKASSGGIDFIELIFRNGCCKPIFVDVFAKIKNRSGGILGCCNTETGAAFKIPSILTGSSI